LHLLEHAYSLERPVGIGNQRFADVEPRESLSLVQAHFEAFLGDNRGAGRSGRPAADHYYVWGITNSHSSFSLDHIRALSGVAAASDPFGTQLPFCAVLVTGRSLRGRSHRGRSRRGRSRQRPLPHTIAFM